MVLIIIATALIPVAVLGWWIYRKDSANPEPIQMLFQALFFGVGSVFVSLFITSVLSAMGLLVYNLDTYSGAFGTALIAAAIPEEIAKLSMLWLFLRKNRYYDEYFDGIVYAACVGLGFAGAENILYLLQSENWIATGVMRALTAVPAHFAMACAMGYFYSKRHFGDKSSITLVCILGVPILIHWIYDALAFSEVIAAGAALSVVFNILFILLLYRVYKSTMHRIDDLQGVDKARMTPPPPPPIAGNGGTLPPPPPPDSGTLPSSPFPPGPGAPPAT